MGAALATTLHHRDLVEKILDFVLRHRRVPLGETGVDAAHEPHLERIAAAVARNEPIVFVLPAFPGKSPNPAKVLSPRADMAERQSLAFLNSLCLRIEALYAPGARIVLCSDGRVFNDVVGIAESDVTVYQNDINDLIRDLDASNLSTFNLDDIFVHGDFGAMRSRLMSDYGQPLEAVQTEVRSNVDAKRLYLGITRFLWEDGLRPDMTISKTALQKSSRHRAYQVIQRSRAWDELLAEKFPHAVRLSIHPQVAGSRKIGIHLMDTADEWLTAWHSVALEAGGRFRLMKRAHVEKLGAQLVYRDGRPSHYVMSFPTEAGLVELV